jgi:hypothetical protein
MFDVTNALAEKEESIILKGEEIPSCKCEEGYMTACSLFLCADTTTPSSCEVNRLETDELLTKYKSGRTNKLPAAKLM